MLTLTCVTVLNNMLFSSLNSSFYLKNEMNLLDFEEYFREIRLK